MLGNGSSISVETDANDAERFDMAEWDRIQRDRRQEWGQKNKIAVRNQEQTPQKVAGNLHSRGAPAAAKIVSEEDRKRWAAQEIELLMGGGGKQNKTVKLTRETVKENLDDTRQGADLGKSPTSIPIAEQARFAAEQAFQAHMKTTKPILELEAAEIEHHVLEAKGTALHQEQRAQESKAEAARAAVHLAVELLQQGAEKERRAQDATQTQPPPTITAQEPPTITAQERLDAGKCHHTASHLV